MENGNPSPVGKAWWAYCIYVVIAAAIWLRIFSFPFKKEVLPISKVLPGYGFFRAVKGSERGLGNGLSRIELGLYSN
jgi:hypothetical protein